jgi:hypothetical protein
LVATRARFSAIQTGSFLGTRQHLANWHAPVIYVHRFADGKVQEAWMDWDALLLLTEQLKAVEETTSGPTRG